MYPEGSAMEVILVVAVAHSEYSMLTNGEEDVKTNADPALMPPNSQRLAQPSQGNN
jgi:hypothetical protein